MPLRFAERRSRSQRIAAADEDPDFQLVVEAARRGQLRRLHPRGQYLPPRSWKIKPGHADGRGPAVIADGQPLEVRQQRIVRTKQPPDRRGVVNRGVEVRVVADIGSNAILDSVLRYQRGTQTR